MMQNKTRSCLLVLASLCHDIGKLLERGGIYEDIVKDPHYLNVCPYERKYLHSAYTLRFCEFLEEHFSCLKELKSNWKIWAAAHHKLEEEFEAKVIKIADRLSSKEREEGDFYFREIHKRTLLEPVLERVFLYKNKNLHTSHRYPLKKAIPVRSNIFPLNTDEFNKMGLKIEEWGKKAEGKIDDPKSWTHMLADPSEVEKIKREYHFLGTELLKEIKRLSSEISLEDIIISLLSLFEVYTSNIPSATNVRHPDISLFDHLRTTAAIAQSLYLYHIKENRNYLGEGLEDEKEEKWLLVCGDFSGIQKFIYNLTNKGAAKGLRGRSFYVQLFCKICAKFIIKKLNLTDVAIIYNSGGKFYLLMPSNMEEELFLVRKEINSWLIDKFGTEVFLGIGTCKINAIMFEQGNMHKGWKKCAESLIDDRTKKFKENMSHGFFNPVIKNFNVTKSCKVCGGRLIKDDMDICKMCNDLENLGKRLIKSDSLLILWKNYENITNMLNIKQPDISINFDNIRCDVILLTNGKLKEIENKKMDGEICIFLKGNKNLTDYHLPRCGLTFMYVARWKKFKNNEEPYTFEDYADNSKGIKRLGILRMDVDNLGMVFEKGLYFPERKTVKFSENGKTVEKEGWGDVLMENGSVKRKPMASISRMATLSRQLNLFFSGYIEKVIDTTIKELSSENKDDKGGCEVIYSGGDDLFIIGSWDILPHLAKRIHDEFIAFCCFNKDMSISGGVYLIPGKYPIYKGAFLAEETERMAKNCRQNWKEYLKEQKNIESSDFEKGGFCFIDSPILWEDFEIAEEFEDLLEKEAEENKGFLSYLIKLTAKNKLKVQNLKSKTDKGLDDVWLSIKYDPWYWRLCYQLKRRYKEEDKVNKWSNLIFNDQNNQSLLPVFVWMDFPINWAKLKLKED